MIPPVKRNEVMAWVCARVSDGTFAPGGLVPSGQELSRITGYNVLTCRRALKELQADGVLISGFTPNSRFRVAGPLSGQARRDAGRALCDELVTRRRAAGLRQPDLAGLIGHSLTSVGHAETGRLWHSRDWWELVDKTLNAGGELIRLHDAYRATSPVGLEAAAFQSGQGEETVRTADASTGRQGTSDLLTADEREAIRRAGHLYALIAGCIVGYGPTRKDDLAEIRAAIHVIQRAVESQAAARAYPREFRLLGLEIGRLPAEPDN